MRIFILSSRCGTTDKSTNKNRGPLVICIHEGRPLAIAMRCRCISLQVHQSRAVIFCWIEREPTWNGIAEERLHLNKLPTETIKTFKSLKREWKWFNNVEKKTDQSPWSEAQKLRLSNFDQFTLKGLKMKPIKLNMLAVATVDRLRKENRLPCLDHVNVQPCLSLNQIGNSKWFPVADFEFSPNSHTHTTRSFGLSRWFNLLVMVF